jgi:broad specificity phosphatase PhoE
VTNPTVVTDLGFGLQCDELAKHLENELPLAQKIELIVVSPMRRTLQTAQQGLGWLSKHFPAQKIVYHVLSILVA